MHVSAASFQFVIRIQRPVSFGCRPRTFGRGATKNRVTPAFYVTKRTTPCGRASWGVVRQVAGIKASAMQRQDQQGGEQ